ncbi:C2 domain-containing protein At1g53590-like isoform X2 [Silene latifolia]|uniref:C2 domain-containing protein At1g53590-like isoform X2 n=2 Tax=Silene latifolia TaxID=37657 RepID=UPI003D76F3C5
MVITKISLIHHVGIVLLLLWLLNSYNCCHSFFYFLSLFYLYQVNETYTVRLRKKLQYDERKAANQRRVLSDSETVRWLNYAVEKMWPICVEPIVSQRIFLAIIPWFLEKYKPWTVRKAVVQHLYLGRTPPLFTDIRVLRESTDDDHLVLELGLNFLTADDMSAILAAKLTKRLGFGMVTKMHLTGLHVEGKVLIGVKFLRCWPFISRLRVCFAEPPYFQMTVKPLFNHGLDVTELPGIAGWLDKLLAIAFEETLVEPNMLVVDLEKFVSPQPENWFSVDVKEPLAYANVEVIEAAEMKPSDLNGLADPYVKGHLGQYRFKTQIQRKTLTPKWQEEFKVPICSWEAQNVLAIEVFDKDHLFDDDLGKCSVNINDLRDGKRHDMWLSLEDVKLGRLHLAVTVISPDGKQGREHNGEEMKIKGDQPNLTEKVPVTSASDGKSRKLADTYEAIDVEGQTETGIWVHHPGSEVSQSWEPRKGKTRHLDTKIMSTDSPKLSSRSSRHDSSSSEGEDKEGHDSKSKSFKKGFLKIFHKQPRDDHKESSDDSIPSPLANVKEAHVKKVGVNLVVDDALSDRLKPGEGSSNEGSGSENTGKSGMRDKAKTMLKNASLSARHLRQAFSRKGSSKFLGSSKQRGSLESDSSDDESLTSSFNDQSVEGIPITSTFMSNTNDDTKPKEQHAQNVTNAAEV